MNSFTKFSRAFFLIVLSVSIFSTVSNVESKTTTTKVVLIDESHGQFINSSLLKGAIQVLKSFGYQVLEQKTPISQNDLNGIDLLIIPNPSRSSTFTASESYAIGQWATNEKDRGVIILSNPLNSQNNSLNGAGDNINSLLRNNYMGVQAQFLISGTLAEDVLVEKYDNNSNVNPRLQLKVNSTVDLPDAFSKNIELISTAITSSNESSVILSAGFDSFTLDDTNTYSGQDTNNKLMIGLSFKAGRIILGGSTLMFSDLPNPYETNTTWFNSANNKEFFGSLVNWVLNTQSQTTTQSWGFEFFLSLVVSMGAIGTTLVIVGVFLYVTGKDMKIFEIDQNFLKSQSADANKDEGGLTKSQKRLQQRSKNK